MQNWLVCSFLGVTCLTLPWGRNDPNAAAGQQEPVWLSDYPAARQAARLAGKPLFVVFRCVP